MRVKKGQAHVLWQHALDGKRSSQRAESGQVVVDDAANLRLRKRVENCDRWDDREQVEHRRIGDEKLLLVLTVETCDVQRDVFRETIVEKAEAAADHHLWWTSRRSRRSWSRRRSRRSSRGCRWTSRSGGFRRRRSLLAAAEHWRPGKGNAWRKVEVAVA